MVPSSVENSNISYIIYYITSLLYYITFEAGFNEFLNKHPYTKGFIFRYKNQIEDWSMTRDGQSWYTSHSTYVRSLTFVDNTKSDNEYMYDEYMSAYSEQPKYPWYKRLWKQKIYPFLYYIR